MEGFGNMIWNNSNGFFMYQKAAEILYTYLGINTVDIYKRDQLKPYVSFIVNYIADQLLIMGNNSEMKDRVQMIFDTFDMGADLIINEKADELATLIGMDISPIDVTPIYPPVNPPEDTPEEELPEEDDNNTGESTGEKVVGGLIINGPDTTDDTIINLENTEENEENTPETPDNDNTGEEEGGENEEEEGGEDNENENENVTPIIPDTNEKGEVRYIRDRFIFSWTNILTALTIRLKFTYPHFFVDEYNGECCTCTSKGQTTKDYDTWTSGVYPEDEMYDRTLLYRNRSAWGTSKTIADVDCGCYRFNPESKED